MGEYDVILVKAEFLNSRTRSWEVSTCDVILVKPESAREEAEDDFVDMGITCAIHDDTVMSGENTPRGNTPPPPSTLFS